MAWTLREGFEAIALLLGPMTPHLAEELWNYLGHTDLVAETPWPEADPSLLVEDQVTIAVQVNGKLRATVELRRNAAPEEAEATALALPEVVRAIAGKPVRRVIVVANRIINVVA